MRVELQNLSDKNPTPYQMCKEWFLTKWLAVVKMKVYVTLWLEDEKTEEVDAHIFNASQLIPGM